MRNTDSESVRRLPLFSPPYTGTVVGYRPCTRTDDPLAYGDIADELADNVRMLDDNLSALRELLGRLKTRDPA